MADIPKLSEFTAEVRNRNVFRQNQYYVEIIPPSKPLLDRTDKSNSKLEFPLPSDARLVSMWCANANTPHSTLMTDDNYLEQGKRRKFAYDQDYQNLILTFYLDQSFSVKRFFDTWRYLTLPHRRKFNYPIEYTAETLNLYIINQQNKPTYKYEYKSLFPKDIQGVELSYNGTQSASVMTVEFVFEEVFITALTDSSSTFTTNPLTTLYPSAEDYNAEVPDDTFFEFFT